MRRLAGSKTSENSRQLKRKVIGDFTTREISRMFELHNCRRRLVLHFCTYTYHHIRRCCKVIRLMGYLRFSFVLLPVRGWMMLWDTERAAGEGECEKREIWSRFSRRMSAGLAACRHTFTSPSINIIVNWPVRKPSPRGLWAYNPHTVVPPVSKQFRSDRAMIGAACALV